MGYDLLVRFLVAGDDASGKHELIQTFTRRPLPPNNGDMTLHVSRGEVDGRSVKLHIWSLGGTSRTVTRAALESVDVVFFCFDCGERTSLINMKEWVRDTLDFAHDDPTFAQRVRWYIVVANASADAAVTPEECTALGQSLDVKMFRFSEGRRVADVDYAFNFAVSQHAKALESSGRLESSPCSAGLSFIPFLRH
ncbi:MAG: uncharacterized protein KVP18_000962 [Porospora cf. gigantea A]|uniref:uncharacterized protein n=2 Tax=Porospora cf. gigantea A TaxID=2853593 RepID=UPI00355A582E|nr:MAG: hypothetical protein KVP18_000962 [Porospora cf. gigantea A]